MNKGKRQLDINQSFDDDTKKLRKIIEDDDKSMTCIETLSNEVFFEIFEYFDGCDLVNTFSNLNSRFQNLLNSSALLLKITLSSKPQFVLENCCEHIVIPNEHRIVSLNIKDVESNDLLDKLFTISALFSRLESLVLHNTPADKLQSILIHLSRLPRLFSLTICHQNVSINFGVIYSLILALPVLKYCKFFLPSTNALLLPLSSNIQNNSIQHLIFRESWSLIALTLLLLCTPRLKRLVCKKLSVRTGYIHTKRTIVLPHLTHISIDTCDMKFEDLEMWIRHISSQLQVFRIATTGDLAYLDADRWERLILNDIPHLRTFDVQYKESIDDLKLTSYHWLINRFSSPFWIQRQWYLEVRIDEWKFLEGSICYSISPLRKRWYDFADYTANERVSPQNAVEHDVTPNGQDLTSDTIQLTLLDLSFINCMELFMDLIGPILIPLQITRLAVGDEISVDVLFEFLRSLPNLTSLIIRRLSLSKTRLVSNTVHSKLNCNKIRKVCLKKLTDLKQVESLMHLCPSMACLETINTKHFDFQSLVRLILRKHGKEIRHDFTLCVKNCQMEDKIIQQLQEIISTEKQNNSCMIACVYGNFYVECKH